MSERLRQRFLGLAVLSALAVIVLPVLLDGSGSESHYQPIDVLVDEPVVARTDRSAALTAGRPVVIEQPAAARLPTHSPQSPAASRMADPPTAWVVQAGAFRDESAAVQVRDRLRATGLPSFVVADATRSDLFRVSVGPMISADRARDVGQQVATMLGSDVQVVKYP